MGLNAASRRRKAYVSNPCCVWAWNAQYDERSSPCFTQLVTPQHAFLVCIVLSFCSSSNHSISGPFIQLHFVGVQEAAAARLKQWQATTHARERSWLDRRIKRLYDALEREGRKAAAAPPPKVRAFGASVAADLASCMIIVCT